MNTDIKDILVDNEGFYGPFGGAYVPEVLKTNIDNLQKSYTKAIADPEFMAEFDRLMRHYVGRPSPLYRASRLSERYGTNIYLKREDLNHTGAHKINNAIGSVLLAKRMGKHKVIAETGAGQHGVATATACALLGLDCVIYMGATDVERQHPNVERMRMLGAEVVAVTSGNSTLKDAVNEALADWCSHPDDTFYVIGSAVGPHPYPAMVARFQSIISEEIKAQLLELEGRDHPDCVIACIGGGSNAAGAFYHFIDRPEVRLIAAEAGGKGLDSGLSAATIHLGREGVLHGSRTLVMLNPDGEVTEPYSISAGLDYPGIGPMQAYLARTGRTEVISIDDDEALRAGHLLTRTEGIIPAIESAHALAVLERMKFGPDDIVVVNLSGRGDKDLATYLADRENRK